MSGLTINRQTDMQVFFLQNVPGIAKKGELRNVKDGYYRNLLAPKKLAVIANDAMVKEAEKIRANEVIQNERLKDEAREVAKRLNGLKIVLKGKSNGDKLYGSFGEKEIIAEIEKAEKIKLEKSSVKLSDPIKVVGQYEIPVEITEGVEAKIILDVKGEKK